MHENEIAREIVNIAFAIHKELGPGLLESVYEEVTYKLLVDAGFNVRSQISVPITFRDIYINTGFRADLIVEDKVLIELKSVELLNPVHYKQVLTYLKLLDIKLGLLINFNVPYIREGIKRIVNGL